MEALKKLQFLLNLPAWPKNRLMTDDTSHIMFQQFLKDVCTSPGYLGHQQVSEKVSGVVKVSRKTL